jgi:hypothetical protein
MFNSEFYPTPPAVIEMMVGGLELQGKHVLEPSAGKGDIVDYVKQLGATVTACEKHPDLAHIVAKKCRFLKADFLEVTAEEVSHVDYIIMNPPFSNADRHIMHAWEIAPAGCEIVALCNYQTIENRFTAMRSRLGRVIESYGFSQNIGDVFSEAERTTGIDIGLVKLFKPVSDSSFEGYFDDEPDEAEAQHNGIMPYNAVREAVQRYVEACRLFDQVADNAVAMNNIVGVFGVDKLAFTLSQDGKEQAVENFKIELQKRAWSWVFGKMNMGKFMTESLRKELNAFVEKQQKVPFTMRNIYKMFDMVIQTHGQRMNRVLEEVFEKLTMHYAENRYNVEGWKTNSHYMVNQKFILEGVGDMTWSGKAHVRWDGRSVKLMDDLCKAICYISGQQYNSNDTLYQFFQGAEVRCPETGRRDYEYKDYGTWYDWQFFQIKLFKKGTLHAKFKDRDVWAMFNRAVAEAKGWQLPEKI